MLNEEPDFEIAGLARDGVEALAMAKDLRPDVITLDVEMPRMSGLEALNSIMRECPTAVLMVSTKTSAGADATIEALEKGAVDFLCKPRSGSFMALREAREELVAKVRQASKARVGIRSRTPVRAAVPTRSSDKTVLIATSTGGPKALTCVFETLPRAWQVPILIVQHMPVGFTASLAARLDRIGTVPCREAVEGDVIRPGLALLAPGGFHMRVDDDGRVNLFDAPLLHGVRPAADFLFESAAKHYGNRCVGAVLTGMGKDGAAGALALKEAGGIVLGEDESTCTVYGMPRAAKEIGAVSAEYPIHEIGHALVATASGRLKGAA
jgi:two-component system chemotaxis response regulator CheB